MARLVKFKLQDGMTPRKLETTPGKPFGLRTPLTVNLPANGKQTVRLGLSCELPVLVVGKSESKLFGPNQELSVDLSSEADGATFGEGEVVAKAYVIDNTYFELNDA